jgi:peptidylprolyl isomerase
MRSPRLVVSAVVLGAIALAACGDASVEEAATLPAQTSTSVALVVDSTVPITTVEGAPSTTSPDKPKVQIPATQPTTLVITDLQEGTGEAAKEGDLVLVNYIGVRSADGTEFDNSYDRGQAFPVTLGAGQVIKGWDQGLVGIKSGGRRQLDIPADLAYGDSPQGDIIKAGDALTFVVDALAVISPSAAPTITMPPAANVTAITSTDLVMGTGTEASKGRHVAIELIAYRSDTGEQLNSTWTEKQPITFTVGDGQLLKSIDQIVTGMKVGGRRQAQIPYAEAFGEAGNPNLKLPAKTDLTLVIDLVFAN